MKAFPREWGIRPAGAGAVKRCPLGSLEQVGISDIAAVNG